MHLERISKTKVLQKATANQKFTDDVNLNTELKDGNWKNLLTDEVTVDGMMEVIGDQYELDDAIVERLEFSYATFGGLNGKNKKWNKLEGGELFFYLINSQRRMQLDRQGERRRLTLNDIKLQVRWRVGDEREEDCSCDSEYMLSAMQRLGERAREVFWWVDRETPMYVLMDNAGGHGTKEAIEEYTSMLKNDFNVEVVFQTPRSPFLNLLDLGVWCSLQAKVEKEHRGNNCETEALARSVMRTWHMGRLDGVIKNVNTRFLKVLKLIRMARGSNRMVEEKRGKRWEDFDQIEIPNDDIGDDLPEEEEFAELDSDSDEEGAGADD